jgi:ribosomal protein L2
VDPIPGELARVLNEQIELLALKLPADDDHKYGFTCECGCGAIVSLTVAAREADGACFDSHKPAYPAVRARSTGREAGGDPTDQPHGQGKRLVCPALPRPSHMKKNERVSGRGKTDRDPPSSEVLFARR